MVIWNRIGKHRELYKKGSTRGPIEPDMCNWIYLKTRIVGIIVPWDQAVWLGAIRGVLAERISCAFQGLTYEVESTPRCREAARGSDTIESMPHTLS